MNGKRKTCKNPAKFCHTPLSSTGPPLLLWDHPEPRMLSDRDHEVDAERWAVKSPTGH